MNKKAAIFCIAILLVISSGVLYLFNSSSAKQGTESMVNKKSSNMQTNQNTQLPQSNNTMATTGSYIDYKDGVIASSTGTKILFFHAPWCPQCRDLESDIKEKGVPSGVTIIKVDYDSSRQLKQKYGVTLQTTMVKIDEKGELIEKFVAYDDPSLSSVVKNLL